MAEFGYNIAFKINSKTLAGRTQDELNITPTIKESITKDDGGNKRQEVVGHEVTFAAQGLVVLTNQQGTTNRLTRDEIMELSLAKGSGAKIPFSYAASSGKVLSGNCVITGYTESSNSEDEANYTVNFKVDGDVTFAAAGGN